MIDSIHTQIISVQIVIDQKDGETYAEYACDDGSIIRILIPIAFFEIVENCEPDPEDDPEDHDDDTLDREAIPGFTCLRCGTGPMPFIDGISGAVPTPFATLPNHIEECLELEPIETQEGIMTTIRYQ